MSPPPNIFLLREWFYYVTGKWLHSISLPPQKSKSQEWSHLPLESGMSKGKGLLERQIEIRPSILSQSARKTRSSAPLLSDQNSISVFYQKAILWKVSMARCFLENSLGLSILFRKMEINCPNGRSQLWKHLVREHAVVEALLWDQLTINQILALLLLPGHLRKATDLFWDSNASFGKWGQSHIIEN